MLETTEEPEVLVDSEMKQEEKLLHLEKIMVVSDSKDLKVQLQDRTIMVTEILREVSD
ncbi:MAG: hypothetical protein WCJ72_04380 [Chryseobacterium sp.]